MKNSEHKHNEMIIQLVSRASHQKISYILCDIFLYKGIMCDKITLTAIAVRTPMPGLTASKERRKRNAFAEIVRSGHSKQTRHAVSRAMRGGAATPFV